MSTIRERGDGCEKCIDGRVDVVIGGKLFANTICDCKLSPQVIDSTEQAQADTEPLPFEPSKEEIED